MKIFILSLDICISSFLSTEFLKRQSLGALASVSSVSILTAALNIRLFFGLLTSVISSYPAMSLYTS
ncbi:hypothetical protein KA977_00470 [Candidatus Dependentiae bacterium]|nr:hypothetical protein [Candidatus Dependentiae bacterium]